MLYALGWLDSVPEQHLHTGHLGRHPDGRGDRLHHLLGRLRCARQDGAAGRRAWAFGISAAAGSFGQFFMIPVGRFFIAEWLVSVADRAGGHHRHHCAAGLVFRQARQRGKLQPAAATQASAGEALRTAFADRSYTLLTLGYFVRLPGGVHRRPSHALPARGASLPRRRHRLALVGLFNCFGTYLAGVLAGKMPKRYVLSFIYFMRSVVIVIFLALPLVGVDGVRLRSCDRILWLSTVPPTNAIIAQVYGVRYLGMLGGIVFFSHQIGSFLGARLGGKLYDVTGNYNTVWMLTIALGVFAAIVHLPIDERALESRTPALA